MDKLVLVFLDYIVSNSIFIIWIFNIYIMLNILVVILVFVKFMKYLFIREKNLVFKYKMFRNKKIIMCDVVY